jgi:ABC-2 type transport system ATP-binding protein
VFFDEPMSGLDPIGRRDIGQIILGLRDRGCTVFFSSHILSDAEALCGRVAILAGGRLVAAGQLSDVLARHARGWELVVSGLKPSTLDRLRPQITSATALGPGRHVLELPLSTAPDRLLSLLVADGASLVSLHAVRDSLEDVFVRRVSGAAAGDRGLSAG